MSERVYGCNNCGTATAPVVLKRTGGFCQPCSTMTVSQTVEALKVSMATYHRMRRAGRLHPIQVSPRRIVYSRSEVESILSGTGQNASKT